MQFTWQLPLHGDLVELAGELHAVDDAPAARQQVVEQQAEGEDVGLLVVGDVASGHLRRSEPCSGKKIQVVSSAWAGPIGDGQNGAVEV